MKVGLDYANSPGRATAYSKRNCCSIFYIDAFAGCYIGLKPMWANGSHVCFMFLKGGRRGSTQVGNECSLMLYPCGEMR
jgi:hypothetical protein